MTPSILSPRLHPPFLRHNLTPRPQLYQRLGDGLANQHRLLLVCAPAGYGKTTLVAGWSASCGLPVAWLSLEEADGDPVQFVIALTAALQSILPDLGITLLGRLQANAGVAGDEGSGMTALITGLVADLASRPPCLLVLDDYHLAATSPVNTIVQTLLAQAPTLTLAITSRTVPELALPRLRLRHQLTEVTAVDLRFSLNEALRFLRQTMQIEVAPALGVELAQRAEGWVGALQLAALSLRGLDTPAQQAFVAAFGGDHRDIADYLTDEVLRQAPPDVHDFLLVTSPLTRLCAPLCDAMLAAAHGTAPAPGASQTLLETVERRNLFLTPLDAQRYWYRYHHLFANLLQARLQREQPGLTSTLHRAAASWWLAAGDGDTAMQHALQCGDADFAAELAQHFGVQMVGGSRLGAFLGWLAALDADAVARRPYLLVGAAWAQVLTGRNDLALTNAAQAEAALDNFTGFTSVVDGRAITAAEVRGHIDAVRSYAARLCGDIDSVVTFSRRALAELPRDAYTVRSIVALNLGLLEMERGELDAALLTCEEAYQMGIQNAANLFVALSAVGLQGEIYLQRGQLQAAAERFQRLLSLGAAMTPTPPAVGMGYLGLARIALLRADPDAAQRLLNEGIRLAAEITSGEAMQEAERCAVEIALFTGDLAEAQRQLAEMDRHALPGKTDVITNVLHSQLALRSGDVSAAVDWLAQAQRALPTAPQSAAAHRQTLEVTWQQTRLLLAQGRPAAALALLASVQPTVHMLADWRATVTTTLLSAHVHYALGETVAAQRNLAAAVALLAPQDAPGPLLAERSDVTTLLQPVLDAGGSFSEFTQRIRLLLAAAPMTSSDVSATSLIEPLSERELEVLRLMAAGYPNKAIADALIVAPSTIKTHVNHILAKLGAVNRTEAVVRARELGLLL